MLGNLAVESISVGDEPVEVSSAVKYLGVWLDNTLDMKKFIFRSMSHCISKVIQHQEN